MRVLVVSPVSPADEEAWGGIHTHTTLLVSLLAEAGMAVTLAAPPPATEALGEGVEVLAVPGAVRGHPGAAWHGGLREAMRRAEAGRPFAAVFSQGCAAWGLRDLRRRRGTRLWAFPHNFGWTHLFNNAQGIQDGGSLRSYLLRTVPTELGRMLGRERPFYRACDGVIAGSAGNALLLRRLYGLPPGRVRLVHNWVDTERFAPDVERRRRARERYGIGERTFLVLFVASLWRAKGFHVAAEGFRRMLRGVPDSVLLAAGRTGGEAAVQRALGGDDADGRIRCLGPARQAALADLYAAADLFVLPTLLWEVLPYVLLEAMASGLPVVATRLGGNVELVGDAGVLVPRKNADALAAAMASLAGDPARRARLGAAARARVVRGFGAAAAAERILACLEEGR